MKSKSKSSAHSAEKGKESEQLQWLMVITSRSESFGGVTSVGTFEGQADKCVKTLAKPELIGKARKTPMICGSCADGKGASVCKTDPARANMLVRLQPTTLIEFSFGR